MEDIEITYLNTDILIIGGGTAGCFAGIHIKEKSINTEVLIAEKAHIKRSGCLAGGINSINAYLNPGQTPRNFLEYIKDDNEGLVRDDLIYTMAKRLNSVVSKLDKWGVPFLKDEAGNYIPKGDRSIKIRGESIKPIIAKEVIKSGVKVINRINITNYLIINGKVRGAFGFSVRENKFYVIKAKAVICATGGASGIYRPNNPGTARHKMWYSPFNTGSGYAMGIRAGAEMTTFEMRFIALRTKDTISPTGSLVQSFGAKQVNNKNQEYQNNYRKNSTPYRLLSTIKENEEGRGPCYLDFSHLNKDEIDILKKSYLNMSPGFVLKLADSKSNKKNIEITGTEPYIVGGHAQSGYWIDVERKTTLEGLFAAGDVAGGVPKKYASGCMVEGEIAAESAMKYINNINNLKKITIYDNIIDREFKRVFKPYFEDDIFNPDELEERLQKIMDEYAGGIKSNYKLNKEKLLKAKELINRLRYDLKKGNAKDLYQLMKFHEVLDRVDVAMILIKHLLYRKETRWPIYQTRLDYPEKDDENWLKFINSIFDKYNDKVKIIEKDYDFYCGDYNDY
jgi:adenylylsulfate reductase subunit A